MTKTGPQTYPGATKDHWYQGAYPGDPMEVNVVVLHTTEGRTLPDYSGGAVAPNLTAVPDFANKKLVWHQHFDIEVSSRALVNAPGGVQTNTFNVTQVELVGTCDPATHKKWGSQQHIYWPEAPEWALREVAHFLAWMHTQHGVPLTGPSKWPAYPASYGASNGARMSGAAWSAFKGICGHMHVTENLHGDPGAIDFPTLVKYAKEIVTPPGGTGAVQPPATQAKPKVSIAKLAQAARTDPHAAQGHKSYEAGVRPVEAALLELGYLTSAYAHDGSYGSTTVKAYAAYQRHLGYSGTAADGIPGRTSLTKLGSQTGLFTVTS